MTTSNKIITQAKAWIGKKESDGSFKEIIDTYNAHTPLARSYKVKYTDEWCATFVSAVAIKCGATNIIPTECGCEKQIELFKKLGSWAENENRTPNVGDIIYYDWQDDGKGDNKGWSDHVGIVEKVSNGKITIIEGNISSKVGRRTIGVNAQYIRGYATPKYEVEKTLKSIEEIAKEVIAGKWGSGDARKKSLTEAGYDYNKVQAKVNELIKPTVKVGSIVKIKSNAKYGGLSSARGRLVPLAVRNKKHTVKKIQTNKGVEEALLKEINSWVAVASLTLA